MRRPRWRAAVALVGLVAAASTLTACSAARTDIGTSDESCYLALPTASRAVGGHGHLSGVRKYAVGNLHALAPKLYEHLAHDIPKGQAVCLVGYTGHFEASELENHLGRASGTVAVAVITTPGNRVLGTLLLHKLPVRFEHSHLF